MARSGKILLASHTLRPFTPRRYGPEHAVAARRAGGDAEVEGTGCQLRRAGSLAGLRCRHTSQIVGDRPSRMDRHRLDAVSDPNGVQVVGAGRLAKMELVMRLHLRGRHDTVTRPQVHCQRYTWDEPSGHRILDQNRPHERTRSVPACRHEQSPAPHRQNTGRHRAETHASVYVPLHWSRPAYRTLTATAHRPAYDQTRVGCSGFVRRLDLSLPVPTLSPLPPGSRPGTTGSPARWHTGWASKAGWAEGA